MRLRHLAAVSLAFALTPLAHATPISYTFVTPTVFGDAPGPGSVLVQGSGALTINAQPGDFSTLTAFSYSFSVTAFGGPTIQATIGLPDVTGFSSLVSGTVDAPMINSAAITGAGADGAFVDLNLLAEYFPSGQLFSLTGNYFVSAGDPEVGQFGTIEYTPVTASSTSVTPEPSGFLLFGTGLLGFAVAVRRRVRQA